jgi:hypothetical protein
VNALVSTTAPLRTKPSKPASRTTALAPDNTGRAITSPISVSCCT